MCDNCEILIHSTKTAEIGSKIGMRVIPFNIQIMNKLLPFYDNVIEAGSFVFKQRRQLL